MKIIFNRIVAILAINFLLLTVPAGKAHAQDVAVSFQEFYDDLAPYGQWVNDAEYGDVWVPNEEPGYRPYATRGHWVLTDAGNMWVSDVPWGWACYHYGRWTYNPYYGWVWLPGYEWAPAWVSWRSGGGMYGWAPMGPGYNPGGYYNYPENYWVFVGPQYLYHPNVYTYYEPRFAGSYMRQTTYINETYVDNGRHTTYYYGPRQQEIERQTHEPVQVYRVSDARQPGAGSTGGNTVSIYRPMVNAQSARTARPANVIRATEPIGKPQEISATHASNPPAFRAVMQQQNPAFKAPNNYNNGAGQQPSHQPAPNTGRPESQHFGNPQQGRPTAPASQANPEQAQHAGVPQQERPATPSVQASPAQQSQHFGNPQQVQTERPAGNEHATQPQQGRQPAQGNAPQQRGQPQRPAQQGRPAAPARNGGEKKH